MRGKQVEIRFGMWKGSYLDQLEWEIVYRDDHVNATQLGNILAEFKGVGLTTKEYKIARDLSDEFVEEIKHEVGRFVEMRYGGPSAT